MTLTIIKNGTRDFTHVTEYANMTFSNYSMVLNNTLQNVIIMRPNGASFPNDAVTITNVFFQDNTDTGVIESFATTELLKARLIEVDYNGLVEASSGGGGATNLGYTASSTNGVVTSSTGTDATIPLADGANAGLLKPEKYTVLENTSGENTGDQDLSGLMVKANNLSDLTNTSTARTNLEVAKKNRIFLTSDITNSTVADADVTGFTFTLGAGEKCDFRVCLPFTAAATGTGINIGVKVVTGVGADGNVLGNTYTKTRLSASTIGAVINVVDQGANATVSYSALSGVSTAGVTNAGEVDGTLENLATNASATIQIIFASEVASSAVAVKRGSSMVIEI